LYLQDYEEYGHTVQLSGISEPENSNIDSGLLAACHGSANPNLSKSGDRSEEIAATKHLAHNNVQVYLAADKFGILSLKSLATKRFASWMTRNWESTAFLEIVQ
jgi:hypothetical protein